KEARGWLKAPYGLRNHEWAYTQIPRKIMVEALLLDESGSIPADYKFSMIHGECAFVQVDNDRFGHFTRSLFDADWRYLDVAWKREKSGDLPRTANFDRMLALAKKLAKDFDYIRVDFYSVNDRVYVGELTNYPGRGRNRFTPIEFDWEVGQRWSIPGVAGDR
ncbi:MAG: ATP-grasp fold amidoligase family protein, partial [Natronospirillum sp.]